MSEPLAYPIVVRYCGKMLTIDSLTSSDTIGDLKEVIFQLSSIRPEKQKLLGLKVESGHSITDNLLLSHLVLRPQTKLLLVGSTEQEINDVNQKPADLPDVVDDLDCKEIELDIASRPEYLAKIERRAKEYKITKLCEPRPTKKLLVLDIDYTIFDHQTPAESARDLMRPYLHEFLARAYLHYDLAIWSATGMTWIRAKLTEMRLITSAMTETVATSDSAEANAEPMFRICLLLDSGAMISVHLPELGVKEVKPLAVIWDQFPQWGPKNTIMFDDVRRNFIMNPQSGLKIRPYKHAPVNRQSDTELVLLAEYLELIARRDDFTTLDHRKWDSYLEKQRDLAEEPWRSKRGRTGQGEGGQGGKSD